MRQRRLLRQGQAAEARVEHVHLRDSPGGHRRELRNSVALRHGRAFVGIDISREYLTEQAVARIDPLAGAARTARLAAEAGGAAQMVMEGMGE